MLLSVVEFRGMSVLGNISWISSEVGISNISSRLDVVVDNPGTGGAGILSTGAVLASLSLSSALSNSLESVSVSMSESLVSSNSSLSWRLLSIILLVVGDCDEVEVSCVLVSTAFFVFSLVSSIKFSA